MSYRKKLFESIRESWVNDEKERAIKLALNFQNLSAELLEASQANYFDDGAELRQKIKDCLMRCDNVGMADYLNKVLILQRQINEERDDKKNLKKSKKQ